MAIIQVLDRCRFDTKDAKRHWYCVVQIREEHVVRWVHVKLIVLVGNLEVDSGHGMIVAIVAVAGVSFAHSWILVCILGKQVARVRLDHEGVREVVVEEVGELHLAIPRVHCEQLRLQLFLHRWNVVLYLQHQVQSAVSERPGVTQSACCRWNGVSLRGTVVVERIVGVARIAIAIRALVTSQGSVLFLGPTDVKLLVCIEGVG